MAFGRARDFRSVFRRLTAPLAGVLYRECRLNAVRISDYLPMNKREIVARVSEETGLTQVQVAEVVAKTFDAIVERLSCDEVIELRNFGVFSVRHRRPRLGRNPGDPTQEISIPARSVVVFKPGKEMKEMVLKLSGKNEAGGAAPDAGANPKSQNPNPK